MKALTTYIGCILTAAWSIVFLPLIGAGQVRSIEFYTGNLQFEADSSIDIPFSDTLSASSIRQFYTKMNTGSYQKVVNALLTYQTEHHLNDWLYYQLVRKVAQHLSAKSENYARYTLYKWFLMSKSGYDSRIAIRDDQIILYIRSDEDIAELPYFTIDKGTYICLNYHDYGKLFNIHQPYSLVDISIPEVYKGFCYKVTRLPEFKSEKYVEKAISFKYKGKGYHFNVKVNQEVNDIFANYPIVDFGTYFNIPLSEETYKSLIPVLRQYVQDLSQEKGVEYLMRFTRYAFLYEDDRLIFGKEKRLSPEQTLMNKASDCDDRAALFFYLVKEIYNLPMIALRFPTHLTIAVQFDRPIGERILYGGHYYSVCEPTPQDTNLKLGEISEKHRQEQYDVVYHYTPH